MRLNFKSQMSTLISMIKVVGCMGTLATGSPYPLAVAITIAEIINISEDIVSGR